MNDISLATVLKLLKTVDAGLCPGVGVPVPGRMCAVAAVCYTLGIPHGDEPDCVGWAVRALVISLNDGDWSSNKARAKGLRKLTVAQLGSNTIVQDSFVKLFALRTVQRLCPLLFAELVMVMELAHDHERERMNSMGRAFASVESLQDEVPALIEFLEELPSCTTDFARFIMCTSAISQILNFALVLDSIEHYYGDSSIIATANTLGGIPPLSQTFSQALNLSLDEALTMMADICLEVLIEMESPGCQWLGLCEVKSSWP